MTTEVANKMVIALLTFGDKDIEDIGDFLWSHTYTTPSLLSFISNLSIETS